MALLLASALIVPLMFTLAQRDVFALTKVIALQIIAGLGILILAVRWMVAGDRPQIVTSATDAAMLVLIALNLVACVLSIRPLHSLLGEEFQYQGFLSVLLYACFFYLSRISFSDERRMSLLFGSIAAGGALVAAYAVAQRAQLDPIWGYPPFGRSFSTIGQPNALAAYLVVAIPVTAALLPRMHATVSRTLVILVVGLMGIALVSTESRGGYIGLVAAVAVLIVPLVRAVQPTARTVLAGLGLATLLIVAAPALRDRGAAIWQRGYSSADFQELSVRRHLDLWAVAVSIARAHPLVGTGQETFPEVFPQYSGAVLGAARAKAFDGVRAESPHNVYLAIAAGAGLPALAAYLALIAGVVFTVAGTIQTRSAEWTRLGLAAVLAAAVGHMVTDTFMTAEVTSSWLFWVLMGVGVGIGREDRQRHTLDGGGPLSAH